MQTSRPPRLTTEHRADHSGLPKGRTPIEFIEWLTTETERGRVRWEHDQDLVATHIGHLSVRFLWAESTLGEKHWRLFDIRDGRGRDLFRTHPVLADADQPPLEGVIGSLFRVAAANNHE